MKNKKNSLGSSGKAAISVKPEKKALSKYKTLFFHLCLICLSSVLFALSFPNPLFINGLPFLAWFAYIPVFIVISGSSLLSSTGWGAVYGYLSYALFNYWLSVFHPLAGLIVYGIYLFFMAALFFFLKLANIFFRRRYYVVQLCIWLAYEYLCTTGFLGYCYGITAYSQWRMIPLIQIADFTGIWGISALVVFPSVWLAAALKDWRIKDRLAGMGQAVKIFFKSEKISAIIWVCALAASLVYGIVAIGGINSQINDPSVRTARIALVQHNTDPWAPSHAPTIRQANEEYRNDLRILKLLSDQALASRPDMVVWSETAFVPRIYWHETYRDDPDSWAMVKDLLDYLASKDVPFVIGNDDARKDPVKNPSQIEDFRIDYNAVMLFERGIIAQTYRKLHLVPFTEHFPYQKQLPFIYNALINADTHFWEKGSETTVFSGPGFTFSTPICFEDTFGYLSRNFVREGADVLVNLSNDAWSKSLPAQYQHLGMAVFRAIENRRPMVRSTASGQTCAIDIAGRITAMAPPFQEAWMMAEIPLIKGDSMYSRYGDYIALMFVAASVVLLLFGAAAGIIKKNKDAVNG